MRDGCMRFNVCVHWSMSWHHKCIGKWGVSLASLATKWSFQMHIAHLAAFWRWSYGGTSWNSTLAVRMNCLRAAEHSLVFPDAYCAFGRILAMVVWRDELEFNVGRAHELFESSRAFIVGFRPRSVRYLCNLEYARSISCLDRFLMGSARMAVES
jgi:hypothetical protein